MSWSVINEIGIDYAPWAESRAQQRLCFPTFAARSANGEYLIGDELGTEKQVPFRFECRTVRVAKDGTTLFDTMAEGIDDGFGCLLDEGYMAVLRRTKWELLILSPNGAVVDVIGLETLSKRMPRNVCWTSRKTFLVVFCNHPRDVEIVEIDRRGRVLWCLPSGNESLGLVGSVQLTPHDTLLIADPFLHVATEIDRERRATWQFGKVGEPASGLLHLSSPSSAKCTADGRRLIADTRNHRVLSLERDGSVSEIRLAEGGLCDPYYVDALPDGHLLVCDTGNARVVELDPRGRVVWQYGNGVADRRILSYPRSVAFYSDGTYLVADTAHDRILEMDKGQIHELPFHGEPSLFWPRCVRKLPTGSLLIADARNRRIVEVTRKGRILKELSKIDAGERQTLQDPHDVRLLHNGHLLIADSPSNLVIEVDWSGHVHRSLGESEGVNLKDPHSAQQLTDGSYVIADTGNHRILWFDPQGQYLRQMDTADGDASLLRLCQPRYAELSPDGTLLIADTGNNRILATTLSGQLIWECSRIPDSRLQYLNQPRWAQLINRREVVISDHFHHRILHVCYEGDGVDS